MSATLIGIDPSVSSPEQVARAVVENPSLLEKVIEGLNAKPARVKYGCAKALRVISEERPNLLYPKFDYFARLLGHENNIFRWEAIFVLSHLARVDKQDKFTDIFDRYFAPIPGPVMITASNVIGASARIAQAKPHLANRIATEVLKVARACYQTPECRNIAIGHAIRAFGEFLGLIENREPVLAFVRSQIKNSRPATRKKAEQFLKRLERAMDRSADRSANISVRRSSRKRLDPAFVH
jgi:hypothetical protein